MGFFNALAEYFLTKPSAPTAAPPAPPPAPAPTVAGIPRAYIDRVAQIESGGDPKAQAPRSSAAGLFQFTDATWRSVCRQAPGLGLTVDPDGRFDPEQATRGFCWLANADGDYFRRATGRDPADFERYLLHFLGAPRGTQVCVARADKPLSAVLGDPGYAAVSRANPFLAGWTAGQLQDWSRSKFA